MYNPFNPLGIPTPLLGPGPVVRRRRRTPLLDRQGIYELCTTGIAENTTGAADATVDYGVNPCVWNALPCECVAVWKVRHTVSTAGAAFPATIVVPGGGRSTVVPTGSTAADFAAFNRKLAIVDNKSTQVAGGDITPASGSTPIAGRQQSYTTEHWVYINKSAGVFRLMGVTAASPAATPTNDTPAAAQ